VVANRSGLHASDSTEVRAHLVRGRGGDHTSCLLTPVEFFIERGIVTSQSIELAGDPESIAPISVGGLKHLPIRYSLR
jgi:hypothetical protein